MKVFKFASLLCALLISSFTGHTAEKQSLLWEITGNGSSSPSYLYGTMHVSNKIAFHLADTFFMGLKQADIIALESDPGTWMEEMFKSRSGLAMNGYSNYVNFDNDKNFYERLSSCEAPEKKTLIAALKNKHALQNGFLYRGSMFEDEYEENTYLDLFIYQYGKKNKKKVLNLEDHEETNILQIKSMLPDPKLSEEEEEEKKKKRKNYYSRWNEDLTVREALEEAYRNGEIFVIDSIMKLTAQSDNYMKYFLYERNRIMTEGIDSLIQGGNKLFIGIGAAHLAGDDGVIQYLKNKGYSLRPIERKITDYAKKEKEKIEEYFLPLEFKKQTTSDGRITCNVPGKLYETPGEKRDLQYFYPEMTNGGYFFIRRFSTFSPLQENQNKDLEKRIDSLLFENIEGKIIYEKDKTVSGFKAKDILNKTRKGDYQRRLIVYTPLELIFFKMSGTGEWVKDYGDQFFESLVIHPMKREKSTYSSHLNDYSIDFKTTPIHNIHALRMMEDPRIVVQSYDDKDSVYQALFSLSLTDYSYFEEDSFELAYITKSFFEQFDSTELSSKKWDKEENSHTSFGKLNGKPIAIKTLLRRNNYFMLLSFNQDSTSALSFLNSFKFEENYKDDPFEWYVDTTLNYKVYTPISPEPLEDLLFDASRKSNNKKKDPWNSNKGHKYFRYPVTNEVISVYRYKYNDYFHEENWKEFWKDELKKYRKGDHILRKITIDQNDTVPTVHMILADTACSKIVEVKKLVNHGVIFTIKANYDSLRPTSAFVRQFMDSFTPLTDSIEETHVLSNSPQIYFNDLRSGDSLRIEKAKDLVSSISFKEAHLDSMDWVIRNFEFPDEEKKESKIYLIRELGYTKSPKAIPYLIKLFEDSDEDSKEQFAALKGLAKVETKQSYKEMRDLLVKSPPIASGYSSVEYLFNYLDDSLKLTKTLYPKILDLSLYTKYRTELFELSSKTLDSGMVKAKKFKKVSPLILRLAKREMVKKSKSSQRVNLSTTRFRYRNGEKYPYEKMIVDQFDESDYLNLLMPNAGKDKSLDKFLAKTYKSQDNTDRFVCAVMAMKHKKEVPDSVIQALSNDPNYLYPLLRDMDFMKRKWKIKPALDATKYDDETIARSVIYAASSNLEADDDSLVFIEKRTLENEEYPTEIYFYKNESSYGSKWYLYSVGIVKDENGNTNLNLDFDLKSNRKTIYNVNDFEKEMDDIMDELEIRKRERASDDY